jgi:uncharacterized caspase-like protein
MDNMKMKRITVNGLRATALFGLSLLLSGSRPRSQGKIYAVLAGISDYATGNDLQHSHLDAIDMYRLLELQTPKANLKLLTNRQAKRDDILRAADELFRKAKPEDMVVFFFSGHGADGSLAAHDRSISYGDLKAVFKRSRAKRKILFSDACFSGAMRSPQQQAMQQQASRKVGSNVLLFLSSRSDEVSHERNGMRNGVFTFFLIAGLKGAADTNRDRRVTARELFEFVNPRVREQTGGRQTPVMWGQFDDRMVILNYENIHTP